jgi:sulfate adenylyltransferase subunit 2
MYFARERDVVVRGEQLIPLESAATSRLLPGERAERVMCRFRTLGCIPCTGAVRSRAVTMEMIIEELMVARHSERITRVIDHDRDGSMELKKREGYF